MNRQERLDWLCRNVQPSEWKPCYLSASVLLGDAIPLDDTVSFYQLPVLGEFNRTEYLARRTELQNKPSWKDAPEWAQWLAQDSDGDWCYYPEKPVTKTVQWVRNDDVPEVWSEMVTCGEVLGDWRDTLGRRPVQTHSREFNPATSSLMDSQTRDIAIETEKCSDGGQCGVGGYCDDCHLFDDETQHSQNADPVHPDDMTPPFEGEIGGFGTGGLSDPVNHPKHYTRGGIECIDALAAATVGKSGIEAVCVANAIKYLWRFDSKGGVEDVKKALWYIDRLISELEVPK